MRIDIKITFGYNQYRLKKVEVKRSMMTKKWATPERLSIADSLITTWLFSDLNQVLANSCFKGGSKCTKKYFEMAFSRKEYAHWHQE